MASVFSVESHDDLLGIGQLTHAQIDAKLQVLEALQWKVFRVRLTAAHLAGEVEPEVVRIPLGTGQSLAGALVVVGSMDGRQTPPGEAWAPASDNLAIEVAVPADPDLRARYLANGGVAYEVRWLS